MPIQYVHFKFSKINRIRIINNINYLGTYKIYNTNKPVYLF